ncbi:MAG: zinc ABC transporter substrate-binding protein [Cellvibrionaceae bacterium]
MRVVASIKPLALIAEDLLGELGEVQVLIRGAASPHDYALRASDIRRLHNADLIIWMGPELERFLEKPLAGLPPEQVLTLGSSASGDLHQWLDPDLAQTMARAITRRLLQLYPAAHSLLEQRLAAVLADYEQLNEELERMLASVRERGFVVEHQGYDYFVRAYRLNQLGWISAGPEQPPGVRHLYQLEKKLRERSGEERARCLFIEHAHQSDTAHNLAEQLNLELRALDILGQLADSYAELMRNLAEDVVDCLA